jgi:hypothetical protein
MKLLLLALSIAVAWAAAAAPASAGGDTVVTKSGRTFVGQIAEELPERVVIKTESGTVVVPRPEIVSINKGATAQKTTILAEKINPQDAAKAFETAKACIAKGEWVKAGSLLEGLLDLDESAFPRGSRPGALSALVTCYLKVLDARGAAKTFTRRAQLASVESDKARLLAAAEALEKTGSVTLGAKTATSFEEAIDTAMTWKAEQCLAHAKEEARKTAGIRDLGQLEKVAAAALKELAEADVFVPGFSTAHRTEPLAALVNSLIECARDTAAFCEKERLELTRTRSLSTSSVAAAHQWNERARPYLAKREDAEGSLGNLERLTTKLEAPDLYKASAAAITELLTKLGELRFYPPGTAFPGVAGSERMQIQLRRVGGATTGVAP